MKWGFILVTLYIGPLGLLLYALADKEPRPGEHESYTAPLWKQGVGSTNHCIAGDATGIILAAAITASLRLPMWSGLLVEYAAGFSFGLLIFQSLFMKSMMGGSYLENVRRSFIPEFNGTDAIAVLGRHEPRRGGRLRPCLSIERLARIEVAKARLDDRPKAAHKVRYQLRNEGRKEACIRSRDARNVRHERRRPDDAFGRDVASSRVFCRRLPARSGRGMFAPWNWLNMGLSARDVGGAIMPPAMVMDRDLSGDAMRDMAAVDPNLVRESRAIGISGDHDLAYKLDGGVKVFDLTASVIRWSILPNVTMDAYAYNGTVPGPRIHIRQGDRVRIVVHNQLPEATTVHWHGLIVPNQMDGPAEVTQAPIKPGRAYTYAFTAVQHGTYFYHPHAHPDRTQALGLYGALIRLRGLRLDR